MNIPMRKISYAGIIFLWLVTTFLLVLRHYGPGYGVETATHAIMPQELEEKQWMGAYYKGEKIGYSSRKTEKSGSGYVIDEFLKMRINVMGSQKTVETLTRAYLGKDLKLESFDFTLKSDVSMSIKGVVKGKNLAISVDAAGLKTEKTIQLKDEPFLNASMIPRILREGIKPNKKFSIMIVDPSTMSQERMNIEVTSKEKISVMGEKIEAFRLKGSFKGMEFYTWITEKGEVLREESPLGFIFVKESREDAMKIEKPSTDLIAQVAVPFNLRLPADVSYLRVRISGISLKGLEIDGGRQRLKGDVVEIQKEEIQNLKFKSQSLKSIDEYLEDTMFIQSKDPQIVSLAKDIVKDEKDRLKAARLIYEWVYRNIEKVPTITIPMATEVLKSKRGDCNEHTTLYVALARAAGIPSRIALGLTYKDGYFYYHAWPEIFLGDWAAIDPTLGQFPADAAHIRITTGDLDKQMQIISVIGKIKLEGLGYR